MSKCEMCGKQTDSQVVDRMVGEIYLCKDCQKTNFTQCKKCSEHFLNEDIDNKICEYCEAE